MNELAILYDHGNGVNKDKARAYYLFYLAGLKRETKGHSGADVAMNNAKNVEKHLSPSTITRLRRLAENCKPANPVGDCRY